MSSALRHAAVYTPAILTLVASLSPGCTRMTPAPATPSGTGSAEELGAPLHVEIPPLAERESLPEAAREMLSGRMLRHGREMVFLVNSVLLLEYVDVAWLADRIAEEPKLGRPRPNEKDTLNALLPKKFFDYQDDLSAQARGLGEAARKQDDEQLVEAFSALTKTCVGCHATYLDEDADDFEHEEPDDETLCEPGERCDRERDGALHRSSRSRASILSF